MILGDLQEDPNVLFRLSVDWQFMPFSTDECKVMHLSYTNRKIKYKMGGMKLDSSPEEKDLGVIFS